MYDDRDMGNEARRRRNLRQQLLRTSRLVNRQIVTRLQACGYPGLRAEHTTLLSNLPLAGAPITEVAERAGITKQAMGRLASDLEARDYLNIAEDPSDGRVRRLELTDTGHRLMAESFAVIASLEQDYAELVGTADYTAFISILGALADAIETMDVHPDRAESL